LRFPMPNFPCDFELPDEWWAEAGMVGFHPTTQAYRSRQAACVVPLTQVEPPYRRPDVSKDWRGFDKARMIAVLHGILVGDEMPAIPLQAISDGHEFPPAPYVYRVRNGVHRFYASVAAGFTRLPAELV
jgi:hypothetical protein